MLNEKNDLILGLMMNNADMPAMPMERIDAHHLKSQKHCNGLTKREYFAIKFGAAYVAGNCAWSGEGCEVGDPTPEMAAVEAVRFADALLAELEKAGVTK